MSSDEGKARKLAQLARSPSDAWLMLRMTGWAILLPLLKHALPIQKLARLMWQDGQALRNTALRNTSAIDKVARMSWRAARLRPLPGRDNCLERSLIAYRYLSGLGADPRIVVAVRRIEESLGGHVWVVVSGEPIAGEDVSPFEPLFEIGARGERVAPAR